jgi:hypothetical protein
MGVSLPQWQRTALLRRRFQGIEATDLEDVPKGADACQAGRSMNGLKPLQRGGTLDQIERVCTSGAYFMLLGVPCQQLLPCLKERGPPARSDLAVGRGGAAAEDGFCGAEGSVAFLGRGEDKLKPTHQTKRGRLNAHRFLGSTPGTRMKRDRCRSNASLCLMGDLAKRERSCRQGQDLFR